MTQPAADGLCKWCRKKLRHVGSTTQYENTGKAPKRCMVMVRTGLYGDGKPCGSTVFTADVHQGWVCEHGHASSGRRKVVSRKAWHEKPGYKGNGEFCTMTCGYKFGLAAVAGGMRRRR
jgi:hypothetical protein